MNLEGDAQKSAEWLARLADGRISYDHVAANATRFGPELPMSVMHTGSHAYIMDCSGGLIRGCVEGGMPRYHEGFGESSSEMAAWAEKHPERLLWSIHGGGRYETFAEAWEAAPRFAFVVVGDKALGDFGHVFSKWDDDTTLESASSTDGLRFGNPDRFTGSHKPTQVLLAPIHYPGFDEVPQEDDVTHEEYTDLLAEVQTQGRAIAKISAFVDEFKSDIPSKDGDTKFPHKGLAILLRKNVIGFVEELKTPTGGFTWSGLLGRLSNAFPKQ